MTDHALEVARDAIAEHRFDAVASRRIDAFVEIAKTMGDYTFIATLVADLFYAIGELSPAGMTPDDVTLEEAMGRAA